MIGRLKFDLDDLANEMLDQLPIELFSSTSTTFLDPCMGGGQFVKAIEQRLRSYGHCDKNIAKRVYGVENSRLRANYAINKHGLVGQYGYCENYLEYNEKMKFDVVIGNPPYQNGKTSNGGAGSLWPKFTKKAFYLVKPSGYVALVTPYSWASNLQSRNTLALMQNDLQIVMDGKKYFPGVGSTFSAWVAQKQTYQGQTHFPDAGLYIDLREYQELPVDFSAVQILQKIYSHNGPKYAVESDNKAAHSTMLKKSPEKLSDKKTKDHQWRMVRIAQDIVWYDGDKPKNYEKPKVVLARTRSCIMPKFYDKNVSTNDNGGHVVVTDATEGQNMVKLLNHKLYKFILKSNKWFGFQPISILSKVPIPAKNPPEDLYAYFGLTQEEIDYIEAAVK